MNAAKVVVGERKSRLVAKPEADTIAFTEKLAHATRGSFQITTDCIEPGSAARRLRAVS